MKSSKNTPKNTNLNRAKKLADRLAQAVGAGYVVATSYAFTHDWLKTHQLNHDFSVAGGILVVSIALYLYCRQR